MKTNFYNQKDNSSCLGRGKSLFAKWLLCSFIITACLFNSFVGKAQNALPSCPTTFTPVNAATDISVVSALTWNAATGTPAVLGYDLYLGTDSALVAAKTLSLRAGYGISALTYTPTGTFALLGNTKYYWLVVSASSFGRATTCTVNSFTTHAPVTKTTTIGGLWSNPATWGGTTAADLPQSNDDVVIANGVTLTVDQVVTVKSVTVGLGGSGAPAASVLQWNATANAMTMYGDLSIASNGKLLPYTAVATPAGVTLNIGGNFTVNGYANLAVTSTTINMCGSTLSGGSTSQTISGTGTIQGNGSDNTVDGIINILQVGTTGTVTLNTTQNIVLNNRLNDYAGTLATNNKLKIDNTAIVYGQALNKKLASIPITGMGAGYTAAPVIFGNATVYPWPSSGTFTNNRIYFFGNNVYQCTTGGGTATGTGPTSTTPAATFSNSGATFFWLGTLGSVGIPYTSGISLVLGTQYFYGDNMYLCTAAGANNVAGAPVHTSGTATANVATLLYIGPVGKVSVNYNASTGTVRSIDTLVGGTYLQPAAAVIAISPSNATAPTTAATAVPVVFTSIQGSVNSLTTKSPSATISGTIAINSGSNTNGFSGVNSLIPGATFGVNYTVAPTVGFGLPTLVNVLASGGSGYGSAPTVTLTGGGGTGAAATAVVAGGKVVSVYITTGGSGYTSWPTLAFTAGTGGGSGATLTAAATLDAGNSLAKATVNMDATARQIQSYTITNAGWGYAAAPTVAFATAGTFTTVAAVPVARIGLYNLTYGVNSPATTSPVSTAGTEIPSNNKINVLTLGSAVATNFTRITLTNNLNIMAGASALSLPTSAVTSPSVLNLNGKTLTFSNPNYSGVGGTPLYGYVTGGDVVLNSIGGNVAKSFPWDAPVVVTPGAAGNVALLQCSQLVAGTTVATASTSLIQVGQFVSGTNVLAGTTVASVGTGTFTLSQATTTAIAAGTTLTFTAGSSTITQLTGSVVYGPSGSLNAGTGTVATKRAFRVQATGAMGATGTVAINYNSLDTLASSTIQQTQLFVGQAGAMTGNWTVKSLSSGTANTVLVQSGTNVSRTTASAVPGLPTPVDLSTQQYFTFVSTTPGNVASSTTGGNWSDPATWANNRVPGSLDTAVIADGAIVTVDVAANVQNVVVGGNGTGAILNWNGTANALTVKGNLVVNAGAKLNAYTSTGAGVTLNIGGNFKLDGTANLAVSGTVLNFTGSTLTGGSLSQEFSGSGTLIGDTIKGGRGIIRTLQIASNNGTVTLNWGGTQKLVAMAFNDYAGNLVTGGYLSIDNTPQVYGQAFNRQVASVNMTAMGSTYSQAPVVFGTAVTPYVSGNAATLNTYYFNGNNVYLCTLAGTFNSTAPTSTSTSTFTTSGPTLLYVGTLGTLGSPYQITALTIGNQYFYGGNLYVANATTAPGAAGVPPTHTSGTVGSFTYLGTPASVSVNYNSTTKNVRSLTLTNAGSGYLSTAPSLVFSVGGNNATQTTAATAVAVMFQQIAGPATAVTTKSSSCGITGGIASIRTDQGVGSVSVATPGVGYTAVPAIGFPLPTNYFNLVTAGGSGYTSAPVAAVTGGTQVAGGAAPAFTVVVAQGKVLSVYCTNGGTGWLTQPTGITLTGGAGTGATAAFPANCLAQARAILNNDSTLTTGSITDFIITNAGFGYESAPTPTFPTGLTPALAATTLSSRLGLYDLSYTYNATATTNPAYVNGAEVPTPRRINKFTMNSVNGATFTNDLEIYGNSTPLTLTAGVVNFATNKTLTFSHQLYRGIGGSTTSAINGDVKATLPGGSVTQQYPFEAPFSVATGAGTGATGSTVINATAKVKAAPTGSNGPIGTRTFEVITNSGSSYGTTPTVTMSWNANDALTVKNNELYIGQSTSTSGGATGWKMISSIGTAGALTATGNRTSATTVGTAPSPQVIFTPTGDDYFAWISPLPQVTNATVPPGGHCAATSQVITADIASASTGWLASPAGDPKLTYSFGAAVQTPITMTLVSGTTYTATIPAPSAANVIVSWGITATNAFGLAANYTGTSYADSAFSAADAPTITATKSTFCGGGSSATVNTTTLTASSTYSGTLTYAWSSLGTGTFTTATTGSSVTANLTETCNFQVIVSSGGCSVNKKISIGVYPFPASTPTVSPASICLGSTSSLSSGLSASNFSVAPINYNRIPVPTNPASVTNFTTLINAGVAVSNSGITTHGTVTGDGGWNNIPIGFTFNYFGTNRTIIGMTTKAVLYMANDNSATNFQYNFPPGFPSTANPAEVIAFCAADYGPGYNFTTGAGSIRYWTQGVAPNRIFVMDYDNIAGYTGGATTTQVQLYETTGNVEVHVTNAQAVSTYSTPATVKYIGLQESTRTIGATAPNTLTGQANYWNGTGDAITAPLAWRFTPPHPYTVSYSPAGQISGTSSGSNLFSTTASPNAIGISNYSVTFTDGVTGCSNVTSPATVALTVVSKPGTPVITSPITVCGSQSVSLTITNAATVPATSNINWYDAAVGGNLLATGVTFVTPVITSTKTYYVAEENSSCSSARIPVQVVINQPPALIVSNPTVCSPGITQIAVTSTASNYDTYIWSPTSDLYQDPAGNVQYTGQSLATVYAKTTASGIYTHSVQSYDFSSGCSNIATSTLTVQPSVDSIIPSVPFICVSGTATLSLSPATSAGSVQWQSSLNGTTYSDIVGETGNTYVTGTLTSPSYYKVKINSGAGTCYTTNVLSLPVNNPQVATVTNGSVCGGGQVVLGATGPGTLNWYSSNTSTSILGSGTSFTTPSISANTDYYVATVVDGCEGTRLVATASISAAPALTVTGAQTVCNNNIATLSVTRDANFDKYVWTPITNLYKNAAATTALATGDTAATVYSKSATAGITTYTVTASNTATSCTATATVNVNVLPTAVTVASFPSTVCSGDYAVLSASVASPASLNGVSYVWESSLNGTNFTQVATTPTYTTPNVTTTTYYRVTIKNGAGASCFTSSPYTLAIATPTVVSTTDGNACANPATVTLGATASAGATLNWYASNSSTTVLGTGTSFTTPSITSSGTYYVAASESGCSSARTAVNANINTPASITVSANQTVCNGAVATLAVTANTDYDTYLWAPKAKLYQDNAATNGYNNQNLSTVYAMTTTAGKTTYTVNASNTLTGCTTSQTTTVTVLPSTATVSASPTTVCSNGASTISISPSTAATYGTGTIEWLSSADNITYTTTGSTGLTYSATNILSNTYFKAVVKDGSGAICLTTSPVLVSVRVVQVLTTTDGNRCTPGTVVLGATASAGATLSWYATNVSTAVLGTGTTYTTTSISSTATYYVAASSNGCTSARSAVTATINTPAAVTVSANQAVCNGGIATLSVTPNSNYNTYSWAPTAKLYQDNAATTAYTNQNLSTVYAMSTVAGRTTYTLTASSSLTGCATTTTTQVTVLRSTATISANPSSICAGGSSTISISPATATTYGPATIEWWSSSDNITYTNTGSTGLTYTSSATSNTYYQAIVKNSAGSICITTAPVLLSVSVPLVVSTQDGSACGTSIVALQATGTAGSTLNWYTAATGGTLVGTGSTFYTPAISATTSYFVEAANGSSCASTRTEVVATINSTTSSQVTVSADQTVCNNGIATLSTPTNADYDTYVWSPASGLFDNNTAATAYSGGNLLTVYAQNATAGVYDYYVTASNSSAPGCVSTAHTVITVLPAALTLSSSADTICNSGSVTLSMSPTTGFGAGSVQWESSSDNVTFSSISGATSTTLASGTLTSSKWFRALIKDASGATCYTSDAYAIEVLTPTVASVTGGSRCGAGTVDLSATASNGTTLDWYAASTGGASLATGTSYQTPSISATTNYYVAASIGSCVSNAPRTQVTATITSVVNPVTVSANQTVCNGAVATLSSPASPDYDTFDWSPATNLSGTTGSSVDFQTTIAGTYTYTLTATSSTNPPPVGCVSTVTTTVRVLPASITLSSLVDTICNSGSTTLSLTPNTGYTGGTILWQSSINGFVSGTPTDLGAATTQSTGTLTATTWFRAIIKDGTGADCIISDPYKIVVNTPAVLTASGNSRCGTGTVTLSATAASGTTLKWYQTSSSTPVLGTGPSFTTPSISATTNYYVAASINTCVGSAARTMVTASINPPSAITATPSTQSVCNGGVASITAGSNPDYDTYIWSPNTNLYQDVNGSVAYTGQNQQTVYYKSTAAGTNTVTLTVSASAGGCTNSTTAQVLVMPGSITLSSTPAQICGSGTAVLSFTPNATFGTGTFQWQSATTLGGTYTNIPNATSATYTTGTVSTETYYKVVVKDANGNNCFASTAYTLSVNNPVVATTADGSVCGTGTATLSATTASGNTLSWYSSLSSTTVLGTGSSFTTPSISSSAVYYVAASKSGCEGTRVAVNATVNPASALTMSTNQTVCNGAIATISVTPNADYTGYVWSPTTNLYSNAGATSAYSSGNTALTTVYVKSTTVGSNTYTVTATNSSTGCTKTGTTTVIVQPSSSFVSSSPSAICVKDIATLSLSNSPSSNVTWTQSPDGVLPYVAIPSATNITYTTDSVSTTSYYKAVIKNDAGATCLTTNAYVLTIDNPSITSVSNANRCGSGALTLTATGSGGTINWYASKTSNSSLGTGASFTTPTLSSTTVYYVSAVTTSGCASAKTDALTDTAYINIAPGLTINPSQIVCNNSTNYMLNVTSNSANYTNYLWTASPSSPVTLYQDSLSATAYNSSTMNEDTVYAKVSVAGTTTYTLNATNSVTGCAASTSAFLSVLPAGTTVTAAPSQLCVTGTATLSLVPSGPYPIGTIQWQGSTDGISWSNIALATTNTLTTIVQSSTRYYHAVIANSSGNACTTTPTTIMTINNPQVLTTTPITRCGKATATVYATASAGATLSWYTDAIGGTLLGTGNSFTTPVLSQTTTYYVEAAIGSCTGGRTAVTVTYVQPPALTLTSTQSVCTNTSIAQINVTSALSNFDTYVWSCDNNSTMYIDANATIPYTGQNITTVYTKSANGYTGTFTVNATSGTGPLACINTANTFVSFVNVHIATVTSSPAVVCKGSTVTLAATADAIIGTGPQLPPTGYLASSATSTADEEIFGVGFGTLNNTSTCGAVSSGVGSVAYMYNNYTYLTAPTVQVGQSVSGSLTLGYCGSTTAWSNTAGVYIDWNRDGDFLDAGEFVAQKAYGALPSLTSPVTYTYTTTVPLNANPGITMMRVVLVESSTISSTGTYSWGETEDYLINVISYVQPNLTYTWTPGGLTGATTTDFVTANTMYTVVGLDPVSGCSGKDSIQVNVTNGPSQPTATNSTQCGFGIPTASVTSTSGAAAPKFTWYSAATSGTVLQAAGVSGGYNTYLTSINADQTFYVSEFNGTCNSYPRTPVSVTVTQPDAITAAATPSSICLGSSINLNVSQTGSTNVYTYSWNGSPSQGSGFQSSTLGSLTTLYNNNFSTSVTPGVISGNASLVSGALQLNPNVINQLGGLTVNGNGFSPDYLSTTFDMTVTPLGGADGMSYSFGDDVSATSAVPNAENGTGTKLKVSFDSYGGAGAGQAGIYVMYNCNVTNQTPTTAGVLAYSSDVSWTGTTKTVNIIVDQAGRLTVSFNGVPLTGLTNIALPSSYLSANKAAWKHVFKGRTGAVSESHTIDNLDISYKKYASVSIAGQSITVTPTSPGTYTYTVTGVDGGCITNSTTTVVVNPLPPAVNAGSDVTICAGNTVTVNASSAGLIPPIRLTELMHQAFLTSGGYNGIAPSFLNQSSTTNDLVEVTNLGSSVASIDGVTLEVWSTGGTAPDRSITIPAGATAPAGGSIYFQWGAPQVSDLVNNYYTGGGTSFDVYGSGGLTGYVLKKNGDVIDAVGVNGFVWPAASNVTSSDWSGSIASNSGLTGSVLIAPDNNTSSSWSITSASVPSSYGTVNPGVTANLPSLGTVAWTSIPAGFSANTASATFGPMNANTQFVATVSNGSCYSTDTVVVNALTSLGTPTIAPATSQTTICQSGSLSFLITNYQPTVTYTWQYSETGLPGTFGNVAGGSGNGFTTPVISNTTYYRVFGSCGANAADTSAAYLVVVQNPILTATADATRCGTGVVTLGATANAGSTVNWYTNAVGGAPVYTGSSYTTPAISTTTTYYAAATAGGFSANVGLTAPPSYYNYSTGVYGVIFDAISPFTLSTVDLYPAATVEGASGTVTIALQNSAGVTLQTTTVNVIGHVAPLTASAKNTVSLGFTVPVGTGYRLTMLSYTGISGLQYDCGTGGNCSTVFYGGAYPTSVPGVITQTGGHLGSATTYNYYVFYFYNWSITTGCETGRIPVTATVNPAPPVTISASASTVCQGQSSVLTASSSDPDYVYTWNGGAYTGSSYTVSPMQSPSVTYNVVANNATTGCAALASNTVNVNITPTTPVITSSNQISCIGGSTTLTASSLAIGAGPQVDPGSSAGNPTFSSTADEEIFNVTLGTLNNTSTCSSTAPGAGSVNSSYNNYTTSVAPPVLQKGNTYNGSITIGYCATGTFSNIAVMWIDYNRNGLFTDPGETVYTSTWQASVLTGTAYPFTVTIPNNATAGLTRMRVVLNESSIAPTPAISSTWGEGEDYLVNILSEVPVTSFNWSTGGTTASISVTPTPGTTNYTVTTTAANGCTSAAGSYSITAAAPPTPVLSATDTTICSPNSIDIYAVDNGSYASGYPAGTTVEWLGYGVTGHPSTTPINSAQGSTFQAKIVLPSGCYANSNVITVNTRAIAVVPTITPAACGNSTGKVVAQITSPPAGPYNYVWTDGTNVVRNVTNSNTKDSITGLAAGTYYLSIYDNQGGALSCSATNLAYTVGGSVPPVISATSSNILCNGNGDGTVGVAITSGGVAPFTYNWSNGSTSASQSSLNGGTYSVTVTDVLGCSATATVTVTEPDAITSTETITLPCAGTSTGSISLNVAGGTAPINVEWFDANGSSLTIGNTLTGIPTGTYYAVPTDGNGCVIANGYVDYFVAETGQTFTSTENACGSYVWAQNGQTYTASGSYTATSGCDSYVLNLTVTPIPAMPTLACYETATFNTGTCAWVVTGTQPAMPTLACYETASFNTTSCSWVVTGSQPAMPTLACYETASFNTTSCSWVVTGSQPSAPTGLACYQTANFNTGSCSWVVTGTQPAMPTLACYQTASFNTTDCKWDITGTQPVAPTGLACYETASFNTTSCSWVVTGTQPAMPTLACYQTASFNTTSCSWVVTGSPAAPIVTTASVCSSYTWTANGQSYTQSGTYNYNSNCQDYTLNLTVTNVSISSLTPSNGAVGSTVVISGSGFTGATGVSFNGTAATSYTVNNSGQITVTVPAGTTTGPVTVAVGLCSATSSGNFTIGSNATLNLTAYMQGYYSGSGTMTSVLLNQGVSSDPNEVDTIRVELYDGATGTSMEASTQGVIMTDGTVSLSLPASVVGNDYYIAVKHRNTVATWSAAAVTFGATTSYDFTTAASQAFGDNMIEVETGVFAMYTGDINQDEFIDPFDYPAFDLDNINFESGYRATDLNGDGFIDPFDYPTFDVNNINFVMSAHP